MVISSFSFSGNIIISPEMLIFSKGSYVPLITCSPAKEASFISVNIPNSICLVLKQILLMKKKYHPCPLSI